MLNTHKAGNVSYFYELYNIQEAIIKYWTYNCLENKITSSQRKLEWLYQGNVTNTARATHDKYIHCIGRDSPNCRKGLDIKGHTKQHNTWKLVTIVGFDPTTSR